MNTRAPGVGAVRSASEEQVARGCGALNGTKKRINNGGIRSNAVLTGNRKIASNGNWR